MEGPARTAQEPDGGAPGGPPTRGRAPASTRRLLLLVAGRTVLTVTGLLVLYYVLPFDQGWGTRTVLILLGGLVLVGALLAWQVRTILRAAWPALRAIEAVALSLPLFLLLFAVVYLVLSRDDPHSFSEPIGKTDALYFVVTVFATVGFGDITAVSQTARVVVTVQMIGDLLLIGIVLRLVLAAVDRGRRRRVAEQGSPPPDG